MLAENFIFQKLETRPRADAGAARRTNIGRVWVNVASPKQRRAVTERQAILSHIDDPDALIRVRS
jgi:hypothetical protein